MSSLLHHLNLRKEGILYLIRDLVERESTSREESYLNDLAHFVARQLEMVGGEVDLIEQSGLGTHLRAEFDFQHEPEARRILVIGHLDTVWPIGTIDKIPFQVTSNGRATGPGIFDMKSGIAIAIEALRAIDELRLKTQRPITVLLTCDEEIGSGSSRPLIEQEAKRAEAALVLEPPLTGGIVKTGRKGIATFTVRALGRAAHSGLDPDKGVNAIVELAYQTQRIMALNDYVHGITVNVGMFNGGTAINVVPAEATAKIDVRFWTPSEGEKTINAIRRLTPVHPESKLEITGGINRPPMPRTEKNIALFEHARGLAAEIGFELRDQVVGGGSDGNFTAALGVPTLDGLGVDGGGAHATNEHIIVSDIPRRAALLTRLMQTV
jgi:glutamate carboxypeptidase